MLRPVPDGQAFIACVQAVADLQDRGERPRPPLMAVSRAPGRKGLGLVHFARAYGLTMDELHEAGRIRAKGFSAQEAVEIVHRSRRRNAEGAP